MEDITVQKVVVGIECENVYIPYTYVSEPDTYRQQQANEMITLGHTIEIDSELFDEYQRINGRFWEINLQLEQLYKKQFKRT